MRIIVWLKIITVTLLTYSALLQLFNYQTWWFIQNVNLIFHEAGHVFMIPFGNTIYTLGGSLFEIGVPLLVMLYFVRRQQYFSATFGAWWLATALLSVSIYAADANEQALPLLGGSAVSHDWHTLLGGWGLLNYDDLIGYLFWLGSASSVTLLLLFLTKDRDVTILLKKALPHETDFSQY